MNQYERNSLRQKQEPSTVGSVIWLVATCLTTSYAPSRSLSEEVNNESAQVKLSNQQATCLKPKQSESNILTENPGKYTPEIQTK